MADRRHFENRFVFIFLPELRDFDQIWYPDANFYSEDWPLKKDRNLSNSSWRYGVVTFRSTQYRSLRRLGALSTSHSVMEGQRHNNPLNPCCFSLQRPKGMELAPNPRYSGGSRSSRRLIYISYASAKTCKGDVSIAHGNATGWVHTNKFKQYKQIYKIQT